jgi:hypothetical protein
MSDQKKQFEVGYKRPPKAGQFVTGQSGNPKGRPRGSQNVASAFLKIARERVRVTINGHIRTITKLEAIMLQLVNKAMAGDVRAAKDVLTLHTLLERTEESKAQGEATHDERDEEVLDRLFKRMQEAEMSSLGEEIVIDPEKSDD